MFVRGWCLLLVALLLAVPVGAEEPATPSKCPESPSATKTLQEVEDEYELQRMLVDTLDQVERNYVKGISRRELIEAAIDGVLRKLDPYSSYIAPEELDRFRSNIDSEFGGIGIQITMDRLQLMVLSPLVDSPAYRAGILAGDRIVEIDGKSTKDIDLDTATKWLKGKTGSKVELTVIHPGRTKREKIPLTRERIHLQTVLGDRRKENDNWDYMYDPEKRIGYLRITVFSRGTAEELRKAVKLLKKQNLTGLILDLRFNAGGLLSSAIEVSDMFIEKGRIVSTSGRNVPERVWDAHDRNTFSDFRMVVLVNRFSASASEIVSACLQDHGRAVIMGERTWGKGSVQNVIPLEHGHSALKLTTASYHRPSGKNIHRFPGASDKDDWGVTPDEGYMVRLSSAETVALLVHRRQQDIIQPKIETPEKPKESPDEEPSKETEPKKPTDDEIKPNRPRHVDRVLQMAIEYLSSELVKAN